MPAADRFPKEYKVHVVTALIALLRLATRRISQDRQKTRERDMHGRGAFTPVVLTFLEHLAQRGAHVIALTPHPVDAEHIATYLDLLRSTTSNENIYAERCDLASWLPRANTALHRAMLTVPVERDIRIVNVVNGSIPPTRPASSPTFCANKRLMRSNPLRLQRRRHLTSSPNQPAPSTPSSRTTSNASSMSSALQSLRLRRNPTLSQSQSLQA
ncbi:hypothetical protein R3P38DRAFT_3169577 [Favolaschia claudopus]|uniref:Uncharacterized protein n=1 Tax=Favolaschia claudopus TaxID=2862362 RepID=A0AAW0DZ49_9AGAR